MATLREWLSDEGFDFDKGKIVFKLQNGNICGGWGDPDETKIHPGENCDWILDHEFDSGFGGPECPMFIADDGEWIYFPEQYDGATGLVCVRKDIAHYEEPKTPTPYPGG